MAMSQGISLAKALKASGKVRTLVSMAAPRPRTATAPRGRGVVIIPTMVPIKTASKCQALRLTPAGAGQNQMAMAIPTQVARSFMLAPNLKGLAAGAGAAAAAVTTGLLTSTEGVGTTVHLERRAASGTATEGRKLLMALVLIEIGFTAETVGAQTERFWRMPRLGKAVDFMSMAIVDPSRETQYKPNVKKYKFPNTIKTIGIWHKKSAV
mmetsp:Transcript_31658/g.57526  ORF Transcript_31658/g.57526 Transcript_31658/m.57526 type:complete len:210 (-) Transcript_31658:28-657(-)